jgi:hypothetical protein
MKLITAVRCGAFVLALASAASMAAQTASTYHVTHDYALGGDGSWDYIVPDPPSHRLYIARQNRVMVVDEDSGNCLGRFPAFRVRTELLLRKILDTGLPPQEMTNPW